MDWIHKGRSKDNKESREFFFSTPVKMRLAFTEVDKSGEDQI